MHKRELPGSEAAAIVSAPETNRHALTLLGAVPFLLRDNDVFIWSDDALCKSLLKIRNGDIPQTTASWAQRMSPEDRRARDKAIRNLSWDGAQYKLSYKIQLDDARSIWIEERGERLSGIEKRPSKISGTLLNVDGFYRSQERAAYLASYDELTALWNKVRLEEGINQIIAFVGRYKSNAVYFQLRVSNITDINDAYGFDTGDRILKSIAQRLGEVMQSPTIIGRVSGCSFGLALYETKEDDAEDIASRLRSALVDVPYSTPHGPLSVKLDIAFTTLGNKARSASEALKQTYTALEVIEDGNDVLIGFTADMDLAETPRRQMKTTADDILGALNDRRISLAFQPIIEAKTRELHHYECLLRLRTDEGAVVSAGSFIMASERLGLVHLLDRRALELAAEALRQYPDIHIALNISAGTVKDRETADAYISALKALGPNVKRVTLELTETVALEDPAMASRFSVEARALGCEFAIDDFGAGYTTFQNLMAIEADTIKIDGSFIEGIANTPHKETFVRMMVDLAQTFGVKTVAEMVDSHADADLLKRLGVDYLQGFMFGVPSAAPAWRKVS